MLVINFLSTNGLRLGVRKKWELLTPRTSCVVFIVLLLRNVFEGRSRCEVKEVEATYSFDAFIATAEVDESSSVSCCVEP